MVCLRNQVFMSNIGWDIKNIRFLWRPFWIFANKKNCSMMTGCHQSDLWLVVSHLPESTIKRCMYSKTHPSHKSPFCHQTNIQNGRRQPFCKKKKISVLIWNGQKFDWKWISDIQNGRRQPFCQKFQNKLNLRIDLKWPEMRLKINFGHPKWAPV